MAKPKFSLTASPTFKVKVSIPVAGGKPVDVEFTFKHRTREAFKKFIESLTDREDVEVILDIASGWDLEDAFDAESLEQMVENHIGSGLAVIQAYISELTAAKVKN